MEQNLLTMEEEFINDMCKWIAMTIHDNIEIKRKESELNEKTEAKKANN